MNSKSLNAIITKVVHKVSFQKNESSVVQTSEGVDLKKLIIDMFRAES